MKCLLPRSLLLAQGLPGLLACLLLAPAVVAQGVSSLEQLRVPQAGQSSRDLQVPPITPVDSSTVDATAGPGPGRLQQAPALDPCVTASGRPECQQEELASLKDSQSEPAPALLDMNTLSQDPTKGLAPEILTSPESMLILLP
jgi:hypothetical protein